MNELASKYDPKAVENKWYEYWMAHRLFHSTPDEREPYCIVIPPPNVTGVLHMGHILNNTIQDILVRRARQLGKNALWVPGTDHAAIATETKVIAKLAAEGIKKTDLTREQFLEHAWDWTRTHGGIILQQLRTLGASCDWERTAFTLDEERSKAVVKVFCDLYDKGLVYRGLRMVNWDPKNRTAISDDEVIYEQENSKLYYLRYYVKDDAEGRYAVVATTRPETIMGDTAMCINPKDPKNEWLKGKTVIVPLVGREIPVIEDRYVDIEFGTGCLKVTPAHDKNDNMLGKTHNLDSIDIFNEDATLNEHGGKYAGMDRFECRKQIAVDLEAAGLMEKMEDYVNNVGYSERTKVAIEPRLSLQWFVKMKHFADIALAPVADDIIKFVPAKYKNTYRIWLENIQDWCISRQLWWGHRIPAWYYTAADGEERFVVAHDAEEALAKACEESGLSLTPTDLRQDEGALDTWFSSWLWPITLFDGILNPGNEEINYYYPTATLVTGPDIIFFWVARMIMAGYEYVGKQPFDNVYFTGIVRDKIGRKMSKSLGNSPDPLDLIATYGADGVRMGMMLAAPAGNDIMYDDSLCEQGRNFCNKMWNAFRLVKGWERADKEQPEASRLGLEWMRAKLKEAVAEVDDLMMKFRISEALMTLFRTFRDEFSGWLLEVVKPAYGEPIDAQTYGEVLEIFDILLRLLHPFMPFITEELWQHIAERKDGESIMYARQPEPEALTEAERDVIARFETLKEVIAGVRTVRKDRGLSQREELTMTVNGAHDGRLDAVLRKMAAVASLTPAAEAAAPSASQSFMVGATEYVVSLEGKIDEAAEAEKREADRKKILEEIAYQEKFLAGVEKKLANERFVANAPEAVVALERKKRADALERIAALKAQV